MCAWSHHYSPSQVKHSHMPQPILKMVPDWTLVPKASGTTGIREHFCDGRVFNPNAQSHRTLQLASVYWKQERERSREITNRESVKSNSIGAFTPLMFSTPGGMAKCASVTYKRLASLLSTKHDQPYSLVIAWLCCHLSFSLLRSAITFLRGTCSSSGRAVYNRPLDLAISEGQVPH